MSGEAEVEVGEVGSIKFPISEAFKYCIESIRKRFTRTLITSLSVLLSIAFLVSLLTMGEILRQIGGHGTEAYQIWVAIIALLVCGVGIVNSMLMSVTERYKEIGTIKCLGATDGAVLEIFLIEALLLGILGGIIGAIVGWAIAVALYSLQGINVFFEGAALAYLRIIGTSIGIAALISLAAAAYPAIYAARLKPAEALRYEI
ncbi:MAG TPA: FtsX-like permease family protein [Candidatus Bathyarchaeota archaeon]|nr:FtsX-like permease family protein [Candidatus Bathyarchaeota archaeon]